MEDKELLRLDEFEAESTDLTRRRLRVGCIFISSVSLLSTFIFNQPLSLEIISSVATTNAAIIVICISGFFLTYSRGFPVPVLVIIVLASCSALHTVVILLTGGVKSPYFSILLIYILGTSYVAASKTIYSIIVFGPICSFYTIWMAAFDRHLNYDILAINVFALLVSSLMGLTGIHTRVNLQIKEFKTRFVYYKERESICRSLHDSLSADLFNIMLQTETIKHGMPDDATIAGKLSDIQEASHRGLENIRDFLFSADRDGMTLGALIGRMEDYGNKLLADRGVDFSFSHDIPDASPPLSTLHTFNLYLIFKEAVINIAKHAHAGAVHVTIKNSPSGLTMTIEDNGAGFDPAIVDSSQYGIKNMKERIAELEGTLHIAAGPGRGVQLTVTAPYSH